MSQQVNHYVDNARESWAGVSYMSIIASDFQGLTTRCIAASQEKPGKLLK